VINELAGRKPNAVQQTWVVYEGEVRPVRGLPGFRRIQSVMCEHLPLVQAGDIVRFEAPSVFLDGEAEVLEHKHTDTNGGRVTLLAIRLIEGEETEEHSG
jgi:hypothetical protein